MIRLNLTKDTPSAKPDADIGMLDVSANALAVLILATMLVLTVTAPPAARGEILSEERPEVFFPAPLDVVIAPQSTFWVVTEAGLTELDLNAFASELALGSPLARTPQGEATLVIDRRNYRDLNDHRLLITLDWNVMRDGAQDTQTAEGVAVVAATIQHSFQSDAVAPTFVVSAAATADFADLFWHLREAEVPMRWVALAEERQLVLLRRSDTFETIWRRWQ